MFKTSLETPEAEIARLADSPIGSQNYGLSQIPVNILLPVQDLLIELPSFSDEPQHQIVVVPMTSHRLSGQEPGERPFRRYNRSWDCIVVASSHPSYPVGGHRISVPEYQLVRGTQHTLALA